ncbi:MAG: hypothetical protein ACK4YO_03730, partial [Candidatus Altarchaeaceae archaeon]
MQEKELERKEYYKLSEKEMKELGRYADEQYRWAAYWRPVVGGLLFGIGGAVIVIGAVFGWTYHLLHQGSLTLLFVFLIG